MLGGMLKDPTSQNQWPTGLVVPAVLALLGSVLGTLVGSLVLWLVKVRPANSGT